MQDLSTIKQELSREGLFAAFKQQLAKDFEQSNFPAGFVATLEPDFATICERIVLVLKGSEQQGNVMQLLYRVDVSEGQLKKCLQEQKDEDPLRVMAELIVKRVLQKVVIKEYYKSKA